MGDFIWVLVPMTALLIPIVAIFSAHQQKMAQILHQSGGNADVNALRQEIAELKTLIHNQSIALDTLAGTQKSLSSPTPAPNLADRLG
ncbi:MAG: hypothetical protein ACHQ50_16380 [Fimbriimonadales bacterium]